MAEEKEKMVLYIEPDDEISSVISQLKNRPEKEVVMVLPKSTVVLQSTVNLKLLQKCAKENKIDLAIVTQDDIGKNLALQVGMKVFDRVDSQTPLISHPGAEPHQTETVEVDLQADQPNVSVHHFQEQIDDKDDKQEGAQEEKTVERKEEAIIEEKIEEPAEPARIYPTIQPPKSPRLRLSLKKKFIIILLLIILAGGFVFIPHAKVLITVIGEPYEQTRKITIFDETKADLQIEGVKLAGKMTPAEKKEQGTFDATGKKNVGQKAKGTIDFYNNWSTESQSIAKGTRLSKDSKIFILLSDITIPGASLSLQEGKVTTNPGKTIGTVEAENAGNEYNVKSGDFIITSIVPEKQSKIYASSAKDLSGGSTQEIKIVSQDDYDNAVANLKDKAEKGALSDIQDKVKGNNLLLEGAVETNIAEKKTDKDVGSQTDKFNVTVKITARTLTINQGEFQKTFLDAVSQEVPANKSLNISANDEIATTVKGKDYDKGILEVVGSIKTQLGPKLDLAAIKKSIVFKNSAFIKDYLAKIDKVEDAAVELKPDWFPIKRTSLLKQQIELKLQYK